VSASQIFPALWGLMALVLGSLFAFRPDIVIRLHRWNLTNYPLGKRLRARMAPQKWTSTFYRIGGVVFMVLGVTVGTLALIGLIRAR